MTFATKSVEDADLLLITVDDALTSLAEEQREDINEIRETGLEPHALAGTRI